MDTQPIHPMQAMVDGMGAAWQKQRATIQMTLGAFIKALEGIDPERKIAGVGGPTSYRGYYCDLAFEPTSAILSVADVLKSARDCMGRVFEGYKGGDFQMGERTPLWSAEYGDSGLRIMGLNLEADPITLNLKEEHES